MLNIRIEKPSIPIIFLDTNFFIDLIKSRQSGVKSAHYQEQEELIELIIKLTKNKKLLCPQGDQSEEYELGSQYEKEIREEQTRLSMGISAMYHHAVKNYQAQIAISAYVNKEAEVLYDYRSIFMREPLKELEEALAQKFLIHVHLPMTKEFLDDQSKTKKEIADEFEKLRNERIKAKITFKQAFQRELLGQLEAIKHTLQTAIPKLASKQSLTKEEENGFLVLGDYMAYLSHYLRREATIKDIADFLLSEYNATVPFASIQSKLYASLLTQGHAIKESDNFDFQQTSQMLPFATYFLTDSSLKHRITSNPLKLDEEYNVKVYSMREIKDLTEELKKL